MIIYLGLSYITYYGVRSILLGLFGSPIYNNGIFPRFQQTTIIQIVSQNLQVWIEISFPPKFQSPLELKFFIRIQHIAISKLLVERGFWISSQPCFKVHSSFLMVDYFWDCVICEIIGLCWY